MLALFLLSAQIFIDGVLVGNFVGANAMASINPRHPDLRVSDRVRHRHLCRLPVHYRHETREGDLQTANDALRTGLVFAFVVSWIIGAIVFIVSPVLITWMGGNDVLMG